MILSIWDDGPGGGDDDDDDGPGGGDDAAEGGRGEADHGPCREHCSRPSSGNLVAQRDDIFHCFLDFCIMIISQPRNKRNIERQYAYGQEEGLGRRLLQGQYNYYSSKRQGGEGEMKECRGRGEECLCITSPNRS